MPAPGVINGTHTPRGRFAPGNSCARGNPLNRKSQKLRAALLSWTTEDQLKRVVKKLYNMAADGDLGAIKEFLDRTIGKATTSIEITDARQRIEDMADEDLIAIVKGDPNPNESGEEVLN